MLAAAGVLGADALAAAQEFGASSRVDFRDYLTWKRHAGESVEGFPCPRGGENVPEPIAWALLAAGSLSLLRSRRPRRPRRR